MTPSPFNPIRFFSDDDNIGGKDYVQIFCRSDRIMLQTFLDLGETPHDLEICSSDMDTIFTRQWQRYDINGSKICSLILLNGMDEGVYFFRIGEKTSNPIMILPDEAEDTVLLQYALTDNRGRSDVMSNFIGNIFYFELRLHGGFKDAGWIFGVDNEQFATQNGDIVELSATDHTDKVLTIGSSSGIPSWLAEIANTAVSSPLAFVDGTRYTRTDSSALGMEGDSNDERHVYTITLREAHYVNAKFESEIRINLRKTPQAMRKTKQHFRGL